MGEGDLVAQRVHFEGTHTGEFQGLPPTQSKVSFLPRILTYQLKKLARRPDDF